MYRDEETALEARIAELEEQVAVHRSTLQELAEPLDEGRRLDALFRRRCEVVESAEEAAKPDSTTWLFRVWEVSFKIAQVGMGLMAISIVLGMLKNCS